MTPRSPQGYVHHSLGLQAKNDALAKQYRRDANEPSAVFLQAHQRLLIEETLAAQTHQRFEARCIATDRSHLHVLLQWRDGRAWPVMRSSLKESYSRKLNAVFGKRSWFSENASRKRVRDVKHFAHLCHAYLPGHPGLKWGVERGVYR